MTVILEEYAFNVPKKKTSFESSVYSRDKKGRCLKLNLCIKCPAFLKQCNGCDSLCPDQKCSGTQCKHCVYLCRRAPQIDNIIEYHNGLDVEMTKRKNIDDIQIPSFIPAINKRLRFLVTYPAVSIPFYAFFDFINDRLIASDLHDYFNLPLGTKIIINFYFKDDKILKLYDKIKDKTFWQLTAKIKNISYWHTICFSVFDISSGMDILMNYKRQFWIGDEMQMKGLNIIQECLYTTSKQKVKAGIEETLEIIDKKNISFISQCGQLTKPDDLRTEISFIRKLSPDIKYLITGYGKPMIETYSKLRPNMYFSNYTGQFKFKTKKQFDDYVYGMKNVAEGR